VVEAYSIGNVEENYNPGQWLLPWQSCTEDELACNSCQEWRRLLETIIHYVTGCEDLQVNEPKTSWAAKNPKPIRSDLSAFRNQFAFSMHQSWFAHREPSVKKSQLFHHCRGTTAHKAGGVEDNGGSGGAAVGTSD